MMSEENEEISAEDAVSAEAEYLEGEDVIPEAVTTEVTSTIEAPKIEDEEFLDDEILRFSDEEEFLDDEEFLDNEEFSDVEEFSDDEESKKPPTTASLHQSFSRTKIPFHILHQRHIAKLKVEAKKDLKQSLEYLLKSVRYSLDGVRLHRMYIAGALVPKFHDIFTIGERKRIEDIITTKWN